MTKLGISIMAGAIADMVAAAVDADSAGWHSIWTTEHYQRSATVPLSAMAAATSAARIGSGIMYGVGRTPLMLATEVRDIDELSGGRFTLGLGNGTRRMIRDWHGQDPAGPARRIEELVPLLRRLFHLADGRIVHHGRYYHVDITPMDGLAPPNREIPIYTAGVNRRMIQAAGRVADGLLGHVLFSPRYVDEVVRPAIEEGTGESGRDPDAFTLVGATLAVIHEDPEVARREAAAQLAFYCSVRSYATVLEVGGFGRQAERARDAFARSDWDGLVAAIDDDMIDALALTGTANDVAVGLQRFSKLYDQISVTGPMFRVSPQRAAENARSLIELPNFLPTLATTASGGQ